MFPQFFLQHLKIFQHIVPGLFSASYFDDRMIIMLQSLVDTQSLLISIDDFPMGLSENRVYSQ